LDLSGSIFKQNAFRIIYHQFARFSTSNNEKDLINLNNKNIRSQGNDYKPKYFYSLGKIKNLKNPKNELGRI
jgi:hypothetical protein